MDKWHNFEINNKVVFLIKIIPKRTPDTGNFTRKFYQGVKEEMMANIYILPHKWKKKRGGNALSV